MPRKKTPELVRLADWQELLALYLDRVREEPFKWGEHDCLIFAAGAVKAMTGVDLSEGLGEYSDEASADAYLAEHNYKNIIAAVTAKLGKKVHPAHAGKGDIVLRGKGKKDLERHPSAIGVCVGRWSWFVGDYAKDYLLDGTPIMTHGLVQVPTLECTAAWKVGAA